MSTISETQSGNFRPVIMGTRNSSIDYPAIGELINIRVNVKKATPGNLSATLITNINSGIEQDTSIAEGEDRNFMPHNCIVLGTYGGLPDPTSAVNNYPNLQMSSEPAPVSQFIIEDKAVLQFLVLSGDQCSYRELHRQQILLKDRLLLTRKMKLRNQIFNP
ncbi:hypothetical protein BDD12DRAFT_890126 [Trichophaea hybrida]|nr:hypothetical protein BDD12DRAFT_890126 [Trichophaea hybrida]